MVKVKTYFFLSLKRKNNRGECPVYCRVAHDGNHRADFSTGIFLHPDEWDYKRGVPKNNTKQANARLNDIQQEIYAAILECERRNVYNPFEVLALYRRKTKQNVYTVLAVVEELLKTETPGEVTISKIRIASKQFVKLTGCVQIHNAIPETLKGFVNEASKTFAPTTVKKKMEFLKRIFVYSFNRGYTIKNPFAGFKMPPVPRLVPVQLTLEEIATIRKKQFDCKRLAQVRDLFLMQCYTGLSFSDLEFFNKSMIQNRKGQMYLIGERQKTKNKFMLPFTNAASDLAKKYNYRLPVLTNQRYNSYLKEIADVCGINKNLTTHVGRKTFAQMMIDKGFSGESVSLMMGHAHFNMTQKHYATISELRIENELLRMVG